MIKNGIILSSALAIHLYGMVAVALFGGIVSTQAQEVEASIEQVRYWAPGVINREEGTIELDVSMRRSPAGMKTDWYVPFRAVGNARDGGNSMLGIAFCPSNDSREFTGIVQDSQRPKSLSTSTPDYDLDRPYRIALRWGNDESSLWFDGRKVARTSFVGELSTLPGFFTVGDPRAFEIHGVRISDHVRTDAQLSNVQEPLQPDDHTTLAYDPEQGLVRGDTYWQVKDYIAGIFPDRRAAVLVGKAGVGLEVPLRVVNYSDHNVDFAIHARVRNRDGDEVATQDYQLTAVPREDYQSQSIQLPALKETGYFDAELTVTGPGERTATYEVSFVVWPAEDATEGALADYLGHHQLLDIKPDFFTQIGIHWNRAWGFGLNRFFLWCNVEPEPGNFEWNVPDEAMDRSTEQVIQTVGLLAGPPAWASTYSPAEYQKFLPVIEKFRRGTDWSRRPDRYQPRSLEEWRNYVRAVVERYHDRVKYWEVYNEVDFHPPNRLASFSGTTQDYVDLLEIVSEEVHAIDPDAVVLSSGFSMVSDKATDLGMPREMLELGGGDYLDAFAFHGYARRELIEDATRAAREDQPGVPLWQTERQYMMGESPRDDYQTVRLAFWGLSQDWDKFFLLGTDTDKHYGNLKPTRYFAVTAELARQLAAAEALEGPVPGVEGRFEAWQLSRADGKYLQYFASGPTGVELTVEGLEPEDVVQVTNLYGETLHDGPIGEELTLALPDDAYVISPKPLSVTAVSRQDENWLKNGSFEEKTGDLIMDASTAWPTDWKLSPQQASPSVLSFVEGRSGEEAIRLDTRQASTGAWVQQRLKRTSAGQWCLRAWVRIEEGQELLLRFSIVDENGRWPKKEDALAVTGTGEWQEIEVTKQIPEMYGWMRAMIGLEEPGGVVEIDDVELDIIR